MGFLDSVKEKLGFDTQKDAYAYEDDVYAPTTREDELSYNEGQPVTPSRPAVDSISVYTRSGKPVDTQIDESGYVSDAVANIEPAPAPAAYASSYVSTPAPGHFSSGKLPAYILRPVAYDDVRTVMQRVRTAQPVVLDFRATPMDTAKRVLDFCFGLTCGMGGTVQELGERAFVVLPANTELSSQEIDKLARDGVIG